MPLTGFSKGSLYHTPILEISALSLKTLNMPFQLFTIAVQTFFRIIQSIEISSENKKERVAGKKKKQFENQTALKLGKHIFSSVLVESKWLKPSWHFLYVCLKYSNSTSWPEEDMRIIYQFQIGSLRQIQNLPINTFITSAAG